MKIVKAYNFIKLHFLSFLLILFYFSEGYNKFSYIYIGERSDIVKIIKLLVIIYVSISLFKKNNILLHIFILIGCFCLGQFSISPNFDYIILTNLLKYLFPLLLFAYFNINKLNTEAKKALQKIFESLVVFNCILIVLGFLFEISVLKTYLSYRFGYNGLLVTSATGSYITLIALFYFLYKKNVAFILDYKVILIIASGLLIGTKSVYFGIGLILILYFILYTSKRHKILGTGIMLLILISGSYYTIHYWGQFNLIMKNEGLFTSILSYRDLLFTNKTVPFINQNWIISNYFFGGVNDITTRPQMGFIDLFYFFGILGSLYYLYLYSTNYMKYKFTREYLLFLCFISVIIAIAGNFFLNSSVVVYMLIIREFNFNTTGPYSTSN